MKQTELKTELKNFTLQNYIEIFIFSVMIVLAIIGYKGEVWATIIYICIVIMLMLTFIFTILIMKWKVDPSAIYYSIYFLNLLVCVAFGWWWLTACWFIILVCAGIGMDRHLKSMEAKKDEN